jgi:hypothetical protein
MTTAQKQSFDFDVLNHWLDTGFCSGPGDGKNAVCMEEAVALCAGLLKTAYPDSCIDVYVSAFDRCLNDRAWSSSQVRSAGLREFAFAQLGTAGKINGRKFSRRVAKLIVVEIVPAALREVRKLVKDKAVQRIAASIARADTAMEKIVKLDPYVGLRYRDDMLGNVATIGVRALKEQLGDEMIVVQVA